MAVGAYYIGLGRQVFWPLVRNGPVGLVVEAPEGLHRVQVKTATWSKSGRFSYLQARIRSSNREITAQSGAYDLVAVVYEHELWIIPAAAIHPTNICLRGSRPGRKDEEWDRFKIR